MPKAELNLNEQLADFARELFSTFPRFDPTNALYLDLEGSAHGKEDVLSLYWPQRAEAERFAIVRRNQNSTAPNNDQVKRALERLQLDLPTLRHVVVFSGGREEPDERVRFEEAISEELLSGKTWINLHSVFRSTRSLKQVVRDHRFVWHRDDRTRVRYSLEALEFEFGVNRNADLRSHSNRYQDGHGGEMRVLNLTQNWIKGKASDEDRNRLRRYCRQDVESMFLVARKCDAIRSLGVVLASLPAPR